jgi:DNA polymerase III epsilon subunit-like protein
MNIFIIDIETTGLDPQKNEILEIGAVNVSTQETFEVKVRPLHIKDADTEALAINGYNEPEWEDSFLLPHALALLSQFVGGGFPRMMSYGVSFDRAFLEKAYKDCNLPYPFHYQHLDLFTLAWFKLPQSERFSLRETCSRLGIEPEPAIHRALAGAQCAYQVFTKLVIPTPPLVGELSARIGR